jgi:hypothetical protein
MRRFATYMAMAVITLVLAAEVCVLWAQSLSDHPAYEVIVSNYGTRNGDTVTNAITQVGNRACLFVFDRGPWQIQTNVTFPTNIGVVVGPDSYFVISNNCTMTFRTNDLVAWHYPVFTGSGTATGTAKMVFRMSQWGSTTQYNIGLGDVETYVTNTYAALGDLASLMTNRYPNLQTNVAANTLAGVLSNGVNAASQNATNFALVQAVTGSFGVVNASTMNIATQNVTGTFLNSSNDMALSFMGYPKLALTSNMFSGYSVGTGSGGGTVGSNFNSLIDNDFSTSTTNITLSDGGANFSSLSLMCTLPTQVVGYVFCKYGTRKNVANGALWSALFSSKDTPTYAPNGTFSDSVNINAGALNGEGYLYDTFQGSNINWYVVPFAGKYVGLRISTANCTGVGTQEVYEVMIYANSNDFRNITGR